MKFVIFCAFFDITTMQQSHLFFQHFLPSFIYDLLYFQLQDAADDGVVSRCQPDKNKYNIVYFCIFSHIFSLNWKYCKDEEMRFSTLCLCGLLCYHKTRCIQGQREDILCGGAMQTLVCHRRVLPSYSLYYPNFCCWYLWLTCEFILVRGFVYIWLISKFF